MNQVRPRRGSAILSYTCALVALTAIVWSAAFLAAGAQDKQEKAAAEKDYKDELPRIPPHEPKDALSTFQVHPGFKIEQVAAEPLVHSPVAVSFDENGRLFVVEMIDYSEQDKDFTGAVRMLEDTDQDGRFDKSTVYVDRLSWPTAVICYDGGVFIGAAPDLFYCKDTDGDGKADVRKVVFTGFGRTNVQGLINSFQWGLDNRIHGQTSSSGGQIRRPDDAKSPVVNLSGRNFSFDPRSLDFTPTSGGAQHGMTYDDWGREFVCSNSDHIQMVMFEDRYVARNPYLAAPSPRVSIAADGPQAEVFRISPVEPWRIVRTRLRVSGAAKGPIEGGGRAAGYFTGATGTTIYRGDAWPAEYRGQAFVGDVGSNIVHRKVLEPNGVGFIAKRVDDGKEFVASKDIWFRPAQFSNGPDGNLYIVDVYREVIEHPASLPPEIKKHLDLTSGRDRGRIYRVVADGFKQKPLPRLGDATTEQLVESLQHRNGWHRDTVARLLYQRQERRAASDQLMGIMGCAPLPEARMHAMYVLRGFGALTPAAVLTKLNDPHPRVREHAVRLSDNAARDLVDVRERLYAMVTDNDLRVRYQLAFTLGDVQGNGRNAALAKLLRRDAGDKWVRLAAFSSLADGSGEVFADLVGDKEFRNLPAGQEVISQLVTQIGRQARQNEVAAVLRSVEVLPPGDGALATALVRGLSEGLGKSGSGLRGKLAAGGGKAEKLFAELLQSSREFASDEKRPLAARVEAIRTLGLGSFADGREILARLLGSRQPQEVQLAAVAALGSFSEAGVGPLLIDAWPGFTPKVRSAATETVFSRGDWLGVFLDAVEKGEIPALDLEPARVKLLESNADPAIRNRAKQLAAKLQLGRRQDVLDAYKPALTLAGDAGRGKMHFQKVCAACHRLENVGNEIGANLAAIQNRGADAILFNVLDPNREVNPQYVNYVVITTEGKSLTGLIAAETATSVTLKRAENQSDTVLRINIEEMRSTGLSIMPEGLEKQLDQQAMADLIAYLTSVK